MTLNLEGIWEFLGDSEKSGPFCVDGEDVLDFLFG